MSYVAAEHSGRGPCEPGLWRKLRSTARLSTTRVSPQLQHQQDNKFAIMPLWITFDM